MTILGLEPGAQIVVLQGLSTYAALASAYFFARPVLRSQTLVANREILTNLKSSDSRIGQLIESAKALLDRRSYDEQPIARRNNQIGVVCLALSFVLFSAALVRQIETEPAFQGTRARQTGTK